MAGTITLKNAMKLFGFDRDAGTLQLKGDPADPQANDQRLLAEGIKNIVERYETDWEEILNTGGSVTVFDSVILEALTKADIYVKDGNQVRYLAKSATFSDGTMLADRYGPTYIVSDGDLLHVTPDGSEDWVTRNSSNGSDFTGTTASVSYTIPSSVDGTTGNKYRLPNITAPSGVKAQTKFYLGAATEPSWQSCTDLEFANGLGSDLDETTGEIAFEPTFFALGGSTLKLEVNFSEEVTVKGGNTSGTDIALDVYRQKLDFHKIRTKKNKPWAAGHSATGAEVTMTSSGTEYKIPVDFTPTKENLISWDSTNKRWNHNSTATEEVGIVLTFTAQHNNGSTREATYHIRNKGVKVTGSELLVSIEENDEMSVTVHVPYLEFASGDYLELYAKMNSSGDKLNTTNVAISIKE